MVYTQLAYQIFADDEATEVSSPLELITFLKLKKNLMGCDNQPTSLSAPCTSDSYLVTYPAKQPVAD